MHHRRIVTLLLALVGALCASEAEEALHSRNASNATLVMRPHPRMSADTFKGVYYMHVMKTAGSTMDGLFWLLAKDRGLNYTTFESPKGPVPTAEERRSSLKVVTLREALSRVISHFWQVRPWGKHKGGADPACRRAAMMGFDHYMLKCTYARNFQSKYFMGTRLRGATLEAFLRNAFDLVILTSAYDEGLMVLHYKYGFTVFDLMYVFKKQRKPPVLQLSDEQLKRMRLYNQADMNLYRVAEKVWNSTMQEVLDVPTFSHSVHNFRQLISEYNDFILSLSPPPKLRGQNAWQELLSHKRRFCDSRPHCAANNLLLST